MIGKIIKGKGFRGTLEYDLRQGKGYLLETNMAGDDSRSLAREFGQIRALRPNLTRAVCHAMLSLPPGESLSGDQWRDVSKQFLEHMDFTENQYVAVRHTDTEHQHMHLIINRVTLSGEVVNDSHDFKRQEVLMRQLEDKYNLTRVTPSQDVSRKSLSKGEVEHALRTGERSIRVRLQNIVSKALEAVKNLETFTALLAKQGVEVRLNKASTGRISGISFSLEGVAMKGSDLGKGFTWSALQKQGLSHEQTRSGQEYGHDGRPVSPQSTGCATTQNTHGKLAGQNAGRFGEERRSPQGNERSATRGQQRGGSTEGGQQKRKGVSR